MTLIVHIGLGKTATTVLQKHVFPALKSEGAIADINPKRLHHRLKRAIHTWTLDDDLRREFANLPSDTVISQEALSGWNPATWPDCLEFNKDLFPKSSSILITMREPVSYLTSVYQQIVQQGNVISPSLFFQSAESYQAIQNVARCRMCEVFSVDDFRMAALVDMYAAHFDRVVVVPLEHIGKMAFLNTLLGVAPDRIARAENVFAAAPRRNKSYSSQAMWLTFRREAFLRSIGARSMGLIDDVFCSFEGAAGHSRDIGAIFPRISKKQRVPTWRRLMQDIVDRYLPYRKYELPEGINLGRYSKENIDFYRQLVAAGQICKGGKCLPPGTNVARA